MSLTTLAIDSNNDLYCPDGQNLSLLEGEDALVQDIRVAGLMRLGEDIFNTAAGIDYFGTIFAAHKDLDGFRVSLVSVITSFDDVVSINKLTITESGNDVIWTAEILTTYGKTTVTNGDS